MASGVQFLREGLVSAHVDSFNYVIDEGINVMAQEISPEEIVLPNKDRVVFKFSGASFGMPGISNENSLITNIKLYPAECRQRGISYSAKVVGVVKVFLNGRLIETGERLMGTIPVMVRSKCCHLAGMTPEQMVAKGEEIAEMGGYFVINGLEKLIRMLLLMRRNYPMAMVRPRWRTRGDLFTEFGVSVRSVRNNHTANVLVLHYLSCGSATLCFTHRKEQFFIPIILVLKALIPATDKYVYDELTRGFEDDDYYKGCVLAMLHMNNEENLMNQLEVLQYLGKKFRIVLSLPEHFTDEEVGMYLLRNCVCIHLDSSQDKFNFLVYMCQKLFALAKGKCKPESPDNPMFQEICLPGHLYLMILKEKFEVWMSRIRRKLEMEVKAKDTTNVPSLITKVFGSAVLGASKEFSRSVEFFLSTGNLVSRTGLGLQQATGFCIIADKLNYLRYVSHFRSVHRGAYFAQMRTTAVRKLLPEAWGFICPVHTPDGSPCGLLNHLAAHCKVVCRPAKCDQITPILCNLGMVPIDVAGMMSVMVQNSYTVMLDGKVLGFIPKGKGVQIADHLRSLKVRRETLNKFVSMYTEVCLVEQLDVCSLYPGLYLFTTPARMMRPVRNLVENTVEYIGTFEQVYLGICITAEDAKTQDVKHQEESETAMLSFVASFTPYSDHNQSPRNMYQCQMGKQTMGTPLHAFQHRADNKLYRIQSPQSPLVRPDIYDNYEMDNYPLGTNAVVAVISYTGYDMEDAMILNKSTFERGFAHGQIYKCERINLRKDNNDKSTSLRFLFRRDPKNAKLVDFMDEDGLPLIGKHLEDKDPYYCYINLDTGVYTVKTYHHMEAAYVDHVKVLGSDNGEDVLCNVAVMLRMPRNPLIGDKFASRHGQKGICSLMWPVENMPFTESGMTPDIIFNPHGFPSRMTIGMMIESMAGKSGATHGLRHDATPFKFSEKQPGINYFGELLTKAGYNYYGNERMYSGVDGREFDVDIFFGVVYYQRLRHMVSDKYQVRTTGPVDTLTHQPVHGRKRGGGVRFGEMERDSLLAHGAAFLVQDRLFNCSDKDFVYVCTKCGSLISTRLQRGDKREKGSVRFFDSSRKWMCAMCKTGDTVKLVPIPYVFRYLLAELASMNIKVVLGVK